MIKFIIICLSLLLIPLAIELLINYKNKIKTLNPKPLYTETQLDNPNQSNIPPINRKLIYKGLIIAILSFIALVIIIYAIQSIYYYYNPLPDNFQIVK